MVLLAGTGTSRGETGFEPEFEEPMRHASGSINRLDVDLGSGNSTSQSTACATSWDNEFHKLPCSLSEIDFPPSTITAPHKTIKSRKKVIPLLVLSPLFVRKENLFQRLSHPRPPLSFISQNLVMWPAMDGLFH